MHPFALSKVWDERSPRKALVQINNAWIFQLFRPMILRYASICTDPE